MPVSTIGAGKDFTSLASWATAKAGNSGTEDAQCFAGNMGALTVNSWTPSSSTIFADASARHNGVDSGTAGLAVLNGVVTLNKGASWVIRGMYSTRKFVNTLDGGTYSFLYDQLLIVNNTSDASIYALSANNANATPLTVTSQIRNSVIIVKNVSLVDVIATISMFGQQGQVVNGSFAFYNTSVFCQTSPTDGIIGSTDTALGTDEADLTILCKNSDVFGPLTCYAGITAGAGGGTMDNQFVSEYCASSDATADDFGGAGTLINQVAANWFTSVPSNLTLKAGSPGINAGESLAVEGFSVDINNVNRPIGPAWDIGAFESALGGSGGGKLISWSSVF